MFQCGISGQMSRPGEKPEEFIVAKRRKDYMGIKFRKSRGRSRPRPQSEPELVGNGWEIAKVIKVRRSILEQMEKEGTLPKPIWV